MSTRAGELKGSPAPDWPAVPGTLEPAVVSGYLEAGRAHENAGRVAEATEAYRATIAAAETGGLKRVQVEAMRRLAVVRHHASDPHGARRLCEASFAIATEIGEPVLAAEALNALGIIAFETGAMDESRVFYHRAMQLGGADSRLRGRIQQNLGILANVQGDHEAARSHYHESLSEFQRAADERGCAIAYHNLGMISANDRRWDEADRYYQRSLELARGMGDLRLEGLCRLNHAEVDLAQGSFDLALAGAEAALRIFDTIDSRLDRADAYRVIGTVYRETGRIQLAEARLRSAIDMARESEAILGEAEADRELALLYRAAGRNQEALALLYRAHRLFGQLDARRDLVEIRNRGRLLEETYLTVVREWGQSIESADSYTFGHCDRVARYGVAVATALGLDEHAVQTIRVGAYLHDLGKVKVPHEILNKPARLTPEEFEIIKKHPGWGEELLAEVEFPWDIRTIIRWHHERLDGTGYPDGLVGDEFPLTAQIIGVVDVWDALTTSRSYRAALDLSEAMARIEPSRGWWSPEVFAAFLAVVPTLTVEIQAEPRGLLPGGFEPPRPAAETLAGRG